RISEILIDNKWNVINNKYYIDDVAKTAREIDIIAYKASKVEDMYVYTSLIISCKKNDEKIWALLTKNLNKNDPNIDLEPLQYWSNHPIINYQLSNSSMIKKFIPTGDLYQNLFEPHKQVFAFQEMFKKNGKPDNDKNIFNSISSLMKSQSYEISSLSKRKKERCVYIFHLVSLIDSELITLDCSTEHIEANKIDSQIYISNYIINGESISSKINFMTTKGFNDLIGSYNMLHQHYCRHITRCHKDFYTDALEDFQKQKILTNELNLKYRGKINSLIYRKLKIFDNYEITSIYEYKGNIEIDVKTKHSNLIDAINDNEELKNEISKIIENVCRVKIGGAIHFNDEIPF
ncbi:TPA: hypothetical protein J5G25_004931, partial [Escherichia coli]|nr:hypothetical protein [Escherichia coli]